MRWILFSLALVFSNPAPAQQSAGKRPLTHNDYDSWRSIQSPQISRDGKFLAYALVPQDGDGEIVVRNLATGRPPPTSPASWQRRRSVEVVVSVRRGPTC